MSSANCTTCDKEIWEKHTGEKCRLVIVLQPDDFPSDWYCLPCYRKVAKVGQHLSLDERLEWSGKGQRGTERQILEVEVTEVEPDYVGWKTVRQLYVNDPMPGTDGKGKPITKGGFSLK